jgi:hypothetical protein
MRAQFAKVRCEEICRAKIRREESAAQKSAAEEIRRVGNII